MTVYKPCLLERFTVNIVKFFRDYLTVNNRVIACVGMATLLWFFAVSASAGTYADYYKQLPVAVAAPELPVIPDRSVSLPDYGGRGDGLYLNTEAFANAIDELSRQGGGHLIVPAGVWLTGPITLKSHIDLHLEKNAIVLFSPDKTLFDTGNRSGRCLPGISATRVTDISISGEGIIDGNGAAWRPVKREKVSDVEWKVFNEAGGVLKQEGKLYYPWEMKSGYGEVAGTPEKQEARRNDLFRINHCERILLRGVTFQNAPKFHVHPLNCRSIVMDGITVRCPWNAQNGDAIDLSDCHRALIVRCIVDAGDDGLCMKSGRTNEKALVNGCEDILIDDNTVYHAHGGFVIGSESVSGLKRIVVRNCRFSGTDTGLRFKSGIGRGGKTEDIYISNIVMNDIKDEAVIFQCTYVDRPAGSEGKTAKAPKELTEVPEFTDIHISDVTCVGCKTAIAASGVEGQNCVHDVEISNSTFVYRKNSVKVDEATAQVKLNLVQLVQYKASVWPKK